MVCDLSCAGEAIVTLDDIFFYIFVAVVVFLDIYFTKTNWRKIKTIEPNLKFDDFEINKFVVAIINRFGEKWGFRFGFVFSFTILAIAVTFLNPMIIYFMAGAYFVVFAFHLTTHGKLNGILEERKRKKNPLKILAKKRIKTRKA